MPGVASTHAQNVRVIQPRNTGAHARQRATIPSAFTVRKGETLGMYSSWTGFSPRDLLIQAGIKNPSEFREGFVLRLLLNPEQWLHVHTARTAIQPQSQGGFQPLKPLQPLTKLDKPKPLSSSGMTFLVHTVQADETAAEIAQYYGLGIDILQQANGGTNFSVITTGQELYVPNFNGKPVPPQAIIIPPAHGNSRSHKAKKVRALPTLKVQ